MAKTIRKPSKATATPAPARPTLVTGHAPRRIAFGGDGISNLSALLALGTRLPVWRYDAEAMQSVVDIDDQTKRDLLSDIHNGVDGLTRVLSQIGMLMAGQDENETYIARQVSELGFSVAGIADLVTQLLSVREQLDNAVAVGGSNG
jgi:hypothetical protein